MTRIAAEMEKQAQKTNFEEGRGKFVKADEAEKLRAQSEKMKMTSAFKAFKKAQAAFEEKQNSAAAKKAIAGLRERNDAAMRQIIQEKQAAEAIAKKEIQKNRQLQADIVKSKLATAFNVGVRFKVSKEDIIKGFAEDEKLSVEDVTEIAKEGRLI